MVMESSTPDPQQTLTPALTPPINIATPKKHAMQNPRKSTRKSKRPITTSYDLTVFEPRLYALMPTALAKELINTMRSIITLGGRRLHLLHMRKQKIEDLLQKLGDNEVIRVYNEFATAHDRVEARTTFKLPLIEELEGGEEEVKEKEDSGDDSEYHSAEETITEARIDVDVSAHEKAELRVAGDPDVDMEDIQPSATVQVPVIHDIEPQIAPSPPASGSQSRLPMPVGVACEKHSNCTVVPVQNPEAFPMDNIQEVQAQYYPYTRVIDMYIHHDGNDQVTQVTATLDKGPVDHLIISDPRIMTHLGLRQPPYHTICLQPNLRIDETFQIHVQSGQTPRSPKAWVIGELVSARHPYLYWLDSRQTADPKVPPTAAEARILAPKIGRRAGDVWREIERVWSLEQGSNGRHFRESRVECLGEDPTYGECGEKRPRRSMWV
jgi:hypothetical protein